jgi:hypothetical protein
VVTAREPHPQSHVHALHQTTVVVRCSLLLSTGVVETGKVLHHQSHVLVRLLMIADHKEE